MSEPEKLVCRDEVPYPDEPASSFPVIMAIVTVIVIGVGACVEKLIEMRFGGKDGQSKDLSAQVVKKVAAGASLCVKKVFQDGSDVPNQPVEDIYMVINGSVSSNDE